jgi:FAD/FMN-containing dehydrogenase
MTPSRLNVEGQTLWRGDAHYEEARRDAVWNEKKPDRFPEMIVTVASDLDVIKAVKFALLQRMKIAVRAGGHSWVGSPIRDGGMLIDLSRLREISIEPKALIARVQPAVTSGELASALGGHRLAFPVGHCASVSMSGYLLAGGLGWNARTWGPACFSVQSVDIVTADGQPVTADEHHNADLFWAARGAGPGFFGVATRFQLRVYELPKVIKTSLYVYPLAEVENLIDWTAGLVPQLPSNVEMQMALASAFPGSPAGPAGKIVALTATAFAESEDEATASLSTLETYPALGNALIRAPMQPSSFKALHETNARLLPDKHRFSADALWSSESVATLVPLLAEQIVRAPSTQSLVMVPLAPPRANGAIPPDAALSMRDKTFILCYAVWENAADDQANETWLRQTVDALEKHITGHYIAEAALDASASRSIRSFAAPNWEKLQALKLKHDPKAVFHTFLGLE